MTVAVQIGTNNANDFFLEICKERKFDKVFLIEPQSRFNREIATRYAGVNHSITNVAITSIPGLTVARLYELNENGGHDSLSKRKSHPSRKEGDSVSMKIVECTTLENFCYENKIESIDLLCIDTEGLDNEIILSIDFEKVPISEIIWEEWIHEDDDENATYKTGPSVNREACCKLRDAGYVVDRYGTSDWIATKQEDKDGHGWTSVG